MEEKKSLKLTGLCTIERAKELQKKMNKALDSADILLINLEAVERIDFSFIQLLYSLKVSCEKKHKTVGFTGEVPPAIVNDLKQAGFSDLVNKQNQLPENWISER